MKHLYQAHTGDLETHQRTIAAHVARLPARKRRLLELRVKGQSLEEIASRDAVSKATISTLITRACEQLRKEIAGEPRYNKIGRQARQ